MNITSYNVTDVSYHYIGLRVLAGTPYAADRNQQIEAISRSVLKFVTDRALRLMLPEPEVPSRRSVRKSVRNWCISSSRVLKAVALMV